MKNKDDYVIICGDFGIWNHSKEELPSGAEYQTAWDQLEKHNWSVDYIISHCCPTKITDILRDGSYRPDHLTDFFDRIMECCKFSYWFFGHHHDNKIIEQKFMLLYDQIIKVPDQLPFSIR